MDLIRSRYNVDGIIGQGAFGRVLATSLKQNQLIDQQQHHSPPSQQQLPQQPQQTNFALKCIYPILSPSRLASELRHLSELGGRKNVVQVHEAIFQKGYLFIVMELIEHDRFVDFVSQLEYWEIKMYMNNLLLALEHIHSNHIMHRDIKPANFLFNRKHKKFSLVDFGLAQNVRTRSTTLFSASHNTNTSNNNNNNNNIQKGLVTNNRINNTTTTPNGLTVANNHNHNHHHHSPPTPMTTTNTTTPMISSPKTPIVTQRRLITSLFHHERNHDSRRDKLNQISDTHNPIVGTPFVNLKSNHMVNQSPVRHQYFNLTPGESPATPAMATKRYLPEMSNDFNQMLKKLRVSNNNHHETKEPVKLTVGAYESPVTHNDSLSRRRNVPDPNHKFSTPTIPRRLVSCECRGAPKTCSTCLSRPDSRASKSGTPGYKAPEVLLKYPFQSTAVDIWSAGVIFACLLSAHSPFFRDVEDNVSIAEIITILGSRRVEEAARKMDIRLNVEPPREPVNLAELCRNIRSSGKDKRQMEIPNTAFDLLQRMLDPNPKTRITAAEALEHECLKEC